MSHITIFARGFAYAHVVKSLSLATPVVPHFYALNILARAVRGTVRGRHSAVPICFQTTGAPRAFQTEVE